MTNWTMDSPVFSFENLTIEENTATLTEKLDAFEKRMIMCALEGSRSVTQAAELLKISKQRLHYKIDKHGIQWKQVIRRMEHDGENDTFHELVRGNLSFIELLEGYEKQLILHALGISVNSKAAADYLGISKQALNYKLNKYHVKER